MKSLSERFQFSSVARSCLTLCNPMDCSTPGLPVHHNLLELSQTHVHRVSDAIQPSVVPFSSRLQSFPASGSFPMSQFFHQVAKILEFQLQHQSFQRIFRIDSWDLLAVQGTLKSLIQHHSSKASILRCSAFFIVQLSHPYMTTEKTIALLPRSKHLLISWLQSPSSVILEPPKIVSHCFLSPSVCHEVMGPGAVILVF